MASQEVKTFYFAGDSKVASSLGTSLEAAGFTKASASEADVVFTYCVSESALEDLYYDSKGLLQSSKKDAVLIDLSPSTVSFAQELCAMGSVSEKHVLDAPLVVQISYFLRHFPKRPILPYWLVVLKRYLNGQNPCCARLQQRLCGWESLAVVRLQRWH